MLYYYVIAPLYAIASGNPQIVSMALGVISMLAIIPLGEMSWLMFRSRQSFVLTLLLFTLSADASLMGTWLSNPTLALITIPTFFYFLYRVFWLKEADKLWLMALFLGLSNQAIIFTLYLFGVVLIPWWLQNYFENKQSGQQQENKKLKFNKKIIIKAVVVYLGSVSTIIATQLLLAKRGIFQLQALVQISTTGTSANTVLGGVFSNYLEVLTNNFTPSKPILTLALLLVTIYFAIKKLTKKNQLFFLIALLSPLVLTSWYYRSAYHTLIGVTPILYVLISKVLIEIKKEVHWGAVISLAIIGVFTISNFQYLKLSNTTGLNPVAIQTGANLKNQLEAIDYTYSQAEGKPFTFSSITSPYGYNTTWSYLYSWYGQTKYHYLPDFVGMSQTGIFGEGLLSEQDAPAKVHFIIYEPEQGIPIWLTQDFINKQNKISTLVEKVEFGSIVVERRVGIE